MVVGFVVMGCGLFVFFFFGGLWLQVVMASGKGGHGCFYGSFFFFFYKFFILL